MSHIRLGDLIVREETKKRRPYRTAEYIAQEIFNASPDPSKIANYYIQSTPILPRPAFMDEFPADTPDLGESEVVLADKLLNPKRPVLVVVGPMGCGKTTTMRYTAMNLVKNRKHCEHCSLPRNRLVAEINFNEYVFLNELKGKELNRRIYSLLCDQLLAVIKIQNLVDKRLEFHDFWKHELTEFGKQQLSSIAFIKIVSESKSRECISFDHVTEEILKEREQLLKQIKKDTEVYLDYVIRLWKFLLETRFCGKRGCAYIILDNLDPMHPNIQRKIVEIVYTHAQLNGPTFVLLVRPESFDQSGLGTTVIDIESHHGPSPITVIESRLEEFCKDPDSYYQPRGGLVRPQFEIMKKYLLNVTKALKADHHQSFSDFLTRACGRSIRAGLIISQNIFYADQIDMENPNISPRELVRLCVRDGDAQLQWHPDGQIEHIFRISTRDTDGLLTKPRIIKYLGTSKDTDGRKFERRKIAEVVNVLVGFGYSAEVVYEAVADLMVVSHQLIRPNGFNALQQDVLRNNGGLNIMLTDIGKNYLNHLMMDIDYVQEVMLDTKVERERFPKEVAYDYLLDKFRLLFLFLQELRRVDRVETQLFLAKWPSLSYRDAFGGHLLSLDIIQGIYPAFTRILRSVQNYDYNHEELISDFESLVLSVENDNETLLKTRLKICHT